MLTVFKDMTIRKLKEEFCKAQKIPIDYNYSFVCNGEVLNDEKTIEYYEMEDDDVIISRSMCFG